MRIAIIEEEGRRDRFRVCTILRNMGWDVFRRSL
jgi:hypothetical protein